MGRSATTLFGNRNPLHLTPASRGKTDMPWTGLRTSQLRGYQWRFLANGNCAHWEGLTTLTKTGFGQNHQHPSNGIQSSWRSAEWTTPIQEPMEFILLLAFRMPMMVSTLFTLTRPPWPRAALRNTNHRIKFTGGIKQIWDLRPWSVLRSRPKEVWISLSQAPQRTTTTTRRHTTTILELGSPARINRTNCYTLPPRFLLRLSSSLFSLWRTVIQVLFEVALKAFI